MLLNTSDWDEAYWVTAGFSFEQAEALAAFAAATIEDATEFRTAMYVSGTAQFLKWSATAADFPNVVYPA